jgi:prolyl-tRNA editing enzyme YbaK/EbsC (Cys-tRNA(Pro) deacylase)
MPHFRVYIDKKVTSKNGVVSGGDHSRVVDLEAEDQADAARQIDLKRNEEINQIVGVSYEINPG